MIIYYLSRFYSISVYLPKMIRLKMTLDVK